MNLDPPTTMTILTCWGALQTFIAYRYYRKVKQSFPVQSEINLNITVLFGGVIYLATFILGLFGLTFIIPIGVWIGFLIAPILIFFAFGNRSAIFGNMLFWMLFWTSLTGLIVTILLVAGVISS